MAIDFEKAAKMTPYREAMFEQSIKAGVVTRRDRRGFERGWTMATLTAMNLVAKMINMEINAHEKSDQVEAP